VPGDPPSPVLRSIRTGTPVGRLTLIAAEGGLTRVLWPGEPLPAGTRPIEATARPHPVLAAAVRQLREYFAGTRTTFDVPLDLRGSAFQREAWLALASIPYGTTRTYGEQARSLGRPAATRAVGAANGRNPVPIVLPCHRLVGADGSLTGFAGGLAVKRALLDHEARVRDGADAASAGTSRRRTSRAHQQRT
jgi:methylated-DNA-[protein]-cysteine S-methyltransferase